MADVDGKEWREALDQVLDHLRNNEDENPPPEMDETLRILNEGGFWEDLRSDDLVGLLLRSHLWCHQLLQEILRENAQDPDRIPNRLSFAISLDLAASTGAPMVDGLYEGLRTLNGIRNRVAHQLGSEPNRNDEAQLATIMTRSLLEDDLPFSENFPLLFGINLAILVVLTARSLARVRFLKSQYKKTWAELGELIGGFDPEDFTQEDIERAFGPVASTNRLQNEEE